MTALQFKVYFEFERVRNAYLVILHIFSFAHGVIFRVNFSQLVS